MGGVTGGEVVVRSLEAQGVQVVFGIPGTHNLEIFRHLGTSGIRHVTPRHEQGAGFAADGYARTSGRPGVCIVTTGPAVTNIATAAAQAYSDSVPMLIVSPCLPTDLAGKASGYLHEAKDQQRAMDSLVAWSYRANSHVEIAEAIARAFREFGNRRPRPVHIEVPIDILEQSASFAAVAPSPRHEFPAADAAQVAAAAARLRQARRPGLVAGGGARGAAGLVQQLAEQWGIPVVTTFNGRGALPESHSLALGAGIHLGAARNFLGDCDVVLAVGTELAAADLWLGGLKLTGELVRVDLDPEQLHKNYPAAVAVQGDATRVLTALLTKLGEAEPARRTTGEERAAVCRARLEAEAALEGGPWIPWMHALRSGLAADAIVAGDSAMVCYYGALRHLPVSGPNQFLYPTGYGTLGYGLPAAIGAKLANPDRQVIALMGDGGFMFTASEFATAVELRLPLPVIVSNNGGYGEIRREMDAARFPRRIAVDLHTPDFAALGRAFGGYGVRITEPAELPAALRTAFAVDAPTLIELRED